MDIEMKLKKKTGASIEITAVEKEVEDKQKRSFTFKLGEDNSSELEALREVLERNTYGGKADWCVEGRSHAVRKETETYDT